MSAPAGAADARSPAATAVIDAVFLTCNSRAQAVECIAHLREPEVASIVVVDNASSDGTAAAIRAAHPDVTVLALDAPAGLATALNRGARVGSAPFVLYLNDDVFAAPGSIRLLLETLRSRDDAVAAGGRLVERDLTTQDRYRPRSFPSALTIVGRLLGLERLWPRNPLTGGHLRRMLDDRTTVAVDQPAGACILVRRSAVERIGGWDERYWFWYEDVDFALRLVAHGTRLYVPSAPFRHVGGSTARRLSRADGHRRVLHGVVVYASTHLSRRGRLLVGLALVAVGAVRMTTALLCDREAASTYAAAARAGASLAAGRRVLPGMAPAGPHQQPAPAADAGCPVCGAATTITERFRPTALRACGACGLLFSARACDADAAQRLYSDDTYAVERMQALTDHRARDARLRMGWVRARVSGRRLLEVGAGAGFFVAEAARQGFEAIGVEPSNVAAQYARSELGADVRTGFLDTADLPEDGFDIACMWHVLEHAADPLALLRGVRARLRARGRLVLEVPNIESVGARMLRGRWAHLDPSAHVCHFSPHSLNAALRAAGYVVIEQGTRIENYYDRPAMRMRPRRIAGRIVRAWRLRTLSPTHPTGGELLYAVAEAGS